MMTLAFRECALPLVAMIACASACRAHAKPRGEMTIFSDLNVPVGPCDKRPASSEFGKRVEAGPEAVSYGFYPKKAWTVTSVELPLWYYTKFGPGHTFRVMVVKSRDIRGLYTPADVTVSGNVLAETVTRKANVFGVSCNLQTITFSPGARIAPDSFYWIVILASPDTYGGWISISKPGLRYSRQSTSEDEGQTWDPSQNTPYPAAFAVYGTPAATTFASAPP